MHPIGQRSHAARVFRVGLDQIERRLAVEDAARHRRRPHFDVDMVRLPHVEDAVFEVLEEQGPQSAGDEVRRRGARVGWIAPALMIEHVDQLGDNRSTSADAVLLHQDRQDGALLIEIGELFAAAGKWPRPPTDPTRSRMRLTPDALGPSTLMTKRRWVEETAAKASL